MEIRVVDFEILTKHYTNYQNGIISINSERKLFIDKLNPLKSEMERIIKAVNSGIPVDEVMDKSRTERFEQLQNQAIEIDNEFKSTMNKLRGDLNIKIFDELSVIISDWGSENFIDLITGKMEVVYSNKKYEATNEILEILKSRGLYTEPFLSKDI